eukprot:m.248169 g.248169  ORF g.248169 m.248169 type:complete len:152 (+) comp40284_c0_seq7:293-748(+)
MSLCAVCKAWRQLKKAMSSYEKYTTVWLSIVDRGGLFKISDSAYNFFLALEVKVRVVLPRRLLHKNQGAGDDIRSIEESSEIQHHWAVVSSDIDDDDDSVILLREIVTLWTTVRGFAITSSWLEQYKRAKGTMTKSKKGLRKSLAQTTNQS